MPESPTYGRSDCRSPRPRGRFSASSPRLARMAPEFSAFTESVRGLLTPRAPCDTIGPPIFTKRRPSAIGGSEPCSKHTGSSRRRLRRRTGLSLASPWCWAPRSRSRSRRRAQPWRMIDRRHQWPMIGHDVEQLTQSAGRVPNRPAERLAPRSEVGPDDGGRRVGNAGRRSAFGGGCEDEDESTLDATRRPRMGTATGAAEAGGIFPDWGGSCGRSTPRAGRCCGRGAIASYNGIAGSISRTSPVLAHGLVYRRRSERQHDGASTPRPATCAGSPSSIRIPARSSPRRRSSTATASTSTSRRTRQPCRGRCRDTSAARSAAARSRSTPTPGGSSGRRSCCPTTAVSRAAIAGGAFVNPPAIDVENGLVYGGAGQPLLAAGERHRLPGGRTGRLERGVLPGRRALQLGGRLRPADRRDRAGRSAAPGSTPGSWRAAASRHRSTWCPAAATATARRFNSASGISPAPAPTSSRRASTAGQRDVVGIGQKSGVYWALDARTGKYLWSTAGRSRLRSRRHPVGHRLRRPADLRRDRPQHGRAVHACRPARRSPAARGRRSNRRPAGSCGRPPIRRRARSRGAHRRERRLYAGSMEHTGDQMYALDTATGDDPLALRRRRFGRRRTGDRRRHGLLGIRLRPNRRRRQQQVLRVQRRRPVAAFEQRVHKKTRENLPGLKSPFPEVQVSVVGRQV